MIPVDAHKATSTSTLVQAPNAFILHTAQIHSHNRCFMLEGEKTVIYNSAFGFKKHDLLCFLIWGDLIPNLKIT